MRNDLILILQKLGFPMKKGKDGAFFSNRDEIFHVLYYLFGDCIFLDMKDPIVANIVRVPSAVVRKKGTLYILYYKYEYDLMSSFHHFVLTPFTDNSFMENEILKIDLCVNNTIIKFESSIITDKYYQVDSFNYQKSFSNERINMGDQIIKYRRKVYDAVVVEKIRQQVISPECMVEKNDIPIIPDMDCTVLLEKKSNGQRLSVTDHLSEFCEVTREIPQENIKSSSNISMLLNYVATQMRPEDLLEKAKQYHL